MPNELRDVQIVQRLLGKSRAYSGVVIFPNGVFDKSTEAGIITFQRRAMRQAFASGIVAPGSETFWRLAEVEPRRMLAGALGGIVLAPFTGEPQPSEEDYINAATELGCEVRSIKAVTAVESPKGPFDKMGRPPILFERHYFSRLTMRQYDGRYPGISNPIAGGYSFPDLDQYVRLQRAYALNATAALKSASWGAFQIMGENHLQAGYATVEQFVRAMCQSVDQQLAGFVSFIKSNPNLLTAIREKNWAHFALRYNGSDYARNHYDTKLAEAYSRTTN